LQKTAVEILRSGCFLCGWNGENLDIKRFSGKKSPP